MTADRAISMLRAFAVTEYHLARDDGELDEDTIHGLTALKNWAAVKLFRGCIGREPTIEEANRFAAYFGSYPQREAQP